VSGIAMTQKGITNSKSAILQITRPIEHALENSRNFLEKKVTDHWSPSTLYRKFEKFVAEPNSKTSF